MIFRKLRALTHLNNWRACSLIQFSFTIKIQNSFLLANAAHTFVQKPISGFCPNARIKTRERFFNLHFSGRGIQFNFPVLTQSKSHNTGECMAFSVDVQDLFYYLPHEKLLQFVQSCIVVYNDEVLFRNESGISVAHSWSCWCFAWVPHMWAGKGNSLSRSREYALGQVLHLCQAISLWAPWTGFSTENRQVCMKKCTDMWMITSSLHRSMDLKRAGTGSRKSLRKVVVVCSLRPTCQLMDKFSSWICPFLTQFLFGPATSENEGFNMPRQLPSCQACRSGECRDRLFTEPVQAINCFKKS